MDDKFIAEKFKELIYDFGEEKFKELVYDFKDINWQIWTNEDWSKYIDKDKELTQQQLKDCINFVKGLLKYLLSENKPN